MPKTKARGAAPVLPKGPHGGRQGPVWMAQQVEVWPVGRLRPYPRNPKLHSDAQVAEIAASILERGFTAPLLVSAEGDIVAGHGRLLAAQQLGLEVVPVVVLSHMDLETRRKYLLADNRLAEQSSWHPVRLAEELAALEAEGLLSATAFSAAELRKIEAELSGSMYAPNVTPETSTEPVTAGDVADTRKRLEERFRQPRVLRPVICPGCGATFEVSGT